MKSLFSYSTEWQLFGDQDFSYVTIETFTSVTESFNGVDH